MRPWLTRLASGLGHRRYMIGVKILSTLGAPTRLSNELRVGPFGPNDLVPFIPLGGMDVGQTLARLDRGDTPWGLWKGNDLVCYGWSSHETTSIADVARIIPQKGDAYLYGFFTHPHHRGHGYYGTLVNEICQAIRKRGCRRAWGFVFTHNRVSRTAVEHLGFDWVAEYRFLTRRLSLKLAFPGLPQASVQPRARGLHITAPMIAFPLAPRWRLGRTPLS